jgi:hypothetical protein
MVGRLAHFELAAHFAEFFSSSKFLTDIAKFFDDLSWGMSFSFHESHRPDLRRGLS